MTPSAVRSFCMFARIFRHRFTKVMASSLSQNDEKTGVSEETRSCPITEDQRKWAFEVVQELCDRDLNEAEQMKAIKGLVYYIAKKKMDDHEVYVKLFEEAPLTQKEQKKGGSEGGIIVTKQAPILGAFLVETMKACADAIADEDKEDEIWWHDDDLTAQFKHQG
jgi:hypothetical protein